MASAKRKRELEGLDAVLPSGGVDLMSSVIASDRRRAGRGEYRAGTDGDDYDNMTSPMTVGQASTNADVQTSPLTDGHADTQTGPPADIPSDTQPDEPAGTSADFPKSYSGASPAGRPQPAEGDFGTSAHPARRQRAALPRSDVETAKPTAGRAILEQRRRQARAAADSRTMTVTLRLPQALNDWLDEYVHQSWPSRIRKQELVVEALQMLIARRGRAGEEVLPTELLEDC